MFDALVLSWQISNMRKTMQVSRSPSLPSKLLPVFKNISPAALPPELEKGRCHRVYCFYYTVDTGTCHVNACWVLHNYVHDGTVIILHEDVNTFSRCF